MRLLLGDAYLDPTYPKDNTFTIKWVNELAQRERLDMQARIVNSRMHGFEKIHNKGIIADGMRVLVSSTNWSNNSPTNNREVGLIIDSPEIADFYTDLFLFDWYDGRPADWPLVVEVGTGDPGQQFVELYNPSGKHVQLGGSRLETTSGRLTLPADLVLQPRQTLVLARDAGSLRRRATGTVVSLPDLRIKENRESVALVGSQGLIDRVAWGGGRPGWDTSLMNGGYCRWDARRDTNTSLDWATGRRSSPGRAGC